jgi:hypothetical protein
MGARVTASIFKIINMSKIKIGIVFAVALAALATDWLQIQKIKALHQENEALQQQAAQVTSLQEQLASAKQDAASASGDAIHRDEQMRDLVRLRGEVTRLRVQSNDLSKALLQIRTLSQDVRRLSQDAASERERASSAAALEAAGAEAHKAQSANACINNLRLIDASKQQWALENKKQSTDTPTMDDLRPYLGRGPNGELPACPDGGVYAIGTVGEKPTCSIPVHVLP